MGNTITRETWKAAPDEGTKLNILFDLLCDTNKSLKETNNRLQKLEKRKRVDSLYSFAGGILGGIVAVAGKMVIWKS